MKTNEDQTQTLYKCLKMLYILKKQGETNFQRKRLAHFLHMSTLVTSHCSTSFLEGEGCCLSFSKAVCLDLSHMFQSFMSCISCRLVNSDAL